ncbi:MAG: hypothetical protein ABMA02_19000 [Saprospiraceae bacterium]
MRHNAPAHFGPFRTIFLLSLALIAFANACSSEDDEQYPQAYKYHEVDFRPTKFYALTATSYNEVATFAGEIDYDSLVLEGYHLLRDHHLLEMIELLDASFVRLTLIISGAPQAVTVLYTSDGDRVSIPFGSGDFVFELDPDRSAARLMLQCVQYTSRKPSGDVEYSPLHYEDALHRDVPALIAQVREKYDLLAGDTVAVNFSNLLYKRQ